MAGGLEFEGQNALVVGGGQGIGRATARVLAQLGACVAVVDSDGARAESVRREIEEFGHEAVAITGDVTDEADAERVVAEACDGLGGLDGVANIVGQASWATLLEVDDATWERDFSLNLKQHLYVARSAARTWIDSERSGVICVVASASGLSSSARHGAYGAAKAGLLSFVQTAAEEWWPHGIRVNAVVPGAVRTPRIESAWAEGEILRPSEDLLDRMALPEDIAHSIVFLLSGFASKITGQSVVVDGGWTTRFPYRLD